MQLILLRVGYHTIFYTLQYCPYNLCKFLYLNSIHLMPKILINISILKLRFSAQEQLSSNILLITVLNLRISKLQMKLQCLMVLYLKLINDHTFQRPQVELNCKLLTCRVVPNPISCKAQVWQIQNNKFPAQHHQSLKLNYNMSNSISMFR